VKNIVLVGAEATVRVTCINPGAIATDVPYGEKAKALEKYSHRQIPACPALRRPVRVTMLGIDLVGNALVPRLGVIFCRTDRGIVQ
jgi:hypothetical protein